MSMTVNDYETRSKDLIPTSMRVTEAYEKGQRWFDQMKELILIEYGLKFTSDFFHETAHWFAGEFDSFGDILHQNHMTQLYGATEAYPMDSVSDVGGYFEQAISLMDGILEALNDFVTLADSTNQKAIARDTENLMVRISRRKENFLYAWKMYEESDSSSSFDKWVKKLGK